MNSSSAIQRWTRRMPARYRFDRFEVRPVERQLLADGRPVALGARAFDVLLALIERHDRLVSKDELLDRVWGKLVVEEANVQVQVSALRKVLGPRALATIPGRGYRFTAPLRDDGAGGESRDLESAHSPSPSPSPPGPPPSGLQTNLPEVLQPLIGRDADVAAIGTLIERQRLITLVGAGGVGKSRVAQWLLHQRRAAFEHGVAWVDLAPLSEPALVAGSIASALGLPLGDATVSGLISALKRLSLLVALDNAEHLIEEVAHIVRAIHEEAPGVHVLVTSQAPLRIAIEAVYRLGPLALPDAALTADQSLGFGAVALFAQRARAADRRFELNEQNLAAVLALCRRLDGLPLAIELAAARVPLLGVKRLADALDQRFRLLTSGVRGAAPRQQTLRGALEWSHALLSPIEQAVFRRIGVFAGSFSLALAQRVAGNDQLDEWAVADALAALIDRSLVSVDGEEPPRYRLLETPRAFALEQLAVAGETLAVRQRHAVAVCALFEEAQVDYFSGEQGIDDWTRRLAPDLDNGRAALGWALEHDAASAVALAVDLALALASTQMHEAQRVLEATAALVIDPLAPALQARWLTEAAYVWIASQPARALKFARRAVALYRALDDRRGLYRSLGLLVSCNPDEPHDQQRSVLAEMQVLEDPAWPAILRARGASATAVVLVAEGRAEEAIAWRKKRDALYEQAGNLTQLALGQASLMDTELAAGRIDDAIERGIALEAQLRGSRQMSALPFAALNLTAAWLAKGDAAAARALAQTYWPMALQLDMQAYWADYLALMAALEGRPAAAARLLGYGDAGYAAKEYTREINEARAVQRTEQIAHERLGEAAFQRLRAAGAALHDDEVAALAFAAQDVAA